jgi:hypothetical protein
MNQPSKCNPDSALPMRGLSKRAQKLLAPKAYGQRPPAIEPRFAGFIPNAIKSQKG